MIRKQLPCYDVCCGAGVFSLGFKRAGFKILGGIDNNKHAIETAQYNIPEGKWEHLPIESLAANGHEHPVKNADIIIAGLPCQGFSVAGKCKPDDHRNYLYKDLLKIVSATRPQFVVIENVRGLIAKRNQKIFSGIINGLENTGYNVSYRLYEAANLGTPQYRKRIVIVASLKIPARYVFEGVQFAEQHKTVKEALKGIPKRKEIASENHTFMVHSPKVIRKISKVKNGGIISYRRLQNDRPSHTIISGHNALPVHPTEHRAISNREAARLQGIPDSFKFQVPRTAQTVQIANAVPFPLAYKIAQAVKNATNLKQRVCGELYTRLSAKTNNTIRNSFRNDFINFYNIYGKDYPWRKISNPYKILATEILLQRTKAGMVNTVWRKAIKSINLSSNGNGLDKRGLKGVMKKLGIFNRVQTLEKMNSKIIQYFGNRIPSNFDELMNLPGVGIYIASAVRTFAFNIPDFPVDTNAFRFISRFYGIKIKAKKSEARQIREFMNTVIPNKKPKQFVYGFLDFCSDVCSPVNPKCNKCSLNHKCASSTI